MAIDTAGGPLLIELDLPAAATIGEALARARQWLPAGDACASQAQAAAMIDWDGGATGIWGERRERTSVPRDGDRIELYRPLCADPRQQRRTRARGNGGRPARKGA
ncbi:MAG TPA: RnfH family protein [Steroidobacteraceae bacterium]|nr:RnfH family protein [Steroidobacteraceae bacterium]